MKTRRWKSRTVSHLLFDTARELIVELQFGEGGTDSKLFVDDLLSAYIRYATMLKFQTEILTVEEGHAILKVTGTGVWQAFKHEGGKHCVQRVPPTERGGRRQTSMISVAVMPLAPVDKGDEIPENELDIIFQCGHGPGGQHQNKTQSACRMKHKPTGITVFINGRDQHSNKREALGIITARVNAFKNKQTWNEYNAIRKTQMDGGGRGNKVRTYNFIESRVTDHRLNLKTGNIKEFMKGNFSVLFDKE
jgi:peptide chain release factor 1